MNEEKRPFIPSFLDDFGLDMPSFRLYLHIVRRAGSNGKCWESVDKMAKVCRMDRKTAYKAFDFLQSHKFIDIEKRKGQTSVVEVLSSTEWLPIPNQVQPYTKSGISDTYTKSGTPPIPNQVQPYTRSGTPPIPNQVQPYTRSGTPPIPDLVHKGTPIEGTPIKGNPKKEKDGVAFSLDSSLQNQAMQQELKTADSANKQDPAPVAPAPKKYADPMGDRFKSGKKHYWQKTISDRPEWQEVLTDWAGTQDCKFGFKGSLLIAQMEHLKKRQLPCEIGDAMGSLANYIKNNDLVSFELRVDAAIAYEKALASNPTLNQPQETESPQSTIQAMPKVGEVDENGMVLMVDCRWEHFYPKLGRLNKTTGDAEIVWGMNNTHPPDPVDERCQKFLEKVQGNPERLAKLLTAKHLADGDFASYQIQSENFIKAKDGLIAALNQEIQKLLSSQAA